MSFDLYATLTYTFIYNIYLCFIVVTELATVTPHVGVESVQILMVIFSLCVVA